MIIITKINIDMKKFSILFIVACAVLMIGSCGNKSEKVPFDNGDSAEVANADPTIYGVCGEETSMNTLQLITDMGDTLTLDISAAQDGSLVGCRDGYLNRRHN